MLHRMQFSFGPPNRSTQTTASEILTSPTSDIDKKEEISEADFMFLYNQGAAAGPGGAIGEIGQVQDLFWI